MPSIAATANALLAKPRPVLCLDTCELLAAVQCLRQRHVAHVETLSRLLTSLVSNPDRVLVVVTELVLHEWSQNLAGVQGKAQDFLAQVDDDSEIVHRAWAHLGRPLATSASAHASSPLVPELTQLAQSVINVAVVLDREPICVDYCESVSSSHVHSTLAPDLAAVGLEYFSDLRSAVGSLRI
jgi:hypothetical protein